MACAACGFESPTGFQFCGECGARLAPSAPARARAWRDREPRTYTPRHLAERVLTSRSALEGERKQVTVLFADVQGSLALAEKLDPEEWHRVLDRFFRILTTAVHRYEGTVNQYTGDGIMALFGAPLAHEDHARRACLAALEMSRGLSEFGDEFRRRHGLEFGVRTGLNSGEVVVGRIGDDLRMDYTAQGWVVGLAARAERQAEAGRICLTESTARLVRGFFRLVPLGRREVRGASEEIALCELDATGGVRTRLDAGERPGAARLVGRAGAVSGLEKALARALAGDGLALGVEGAPGVGKSRLCLEFVARCRARGLRVAEAHCPTHARSLSHAATLDLLRAFFFGEGDPARRETARRRIEADCADLSAAARAGIPELLARLDLADPAAAPTGDPSEREERLGRLACHAIRACASREPILVFVDDLHWIDPASEAFLAELVDGLAGTRGLLLVTFRSDHHAPWMEHPSFHQIGLPPLDRAESLQLIRELVGAEPAGGELAERVYERVGGNPLFIEESLRSLVESGRLRGEPGRYVWVGPMGDLEIPPSVRAVIAARIDRLEDGLKRMLQAASVIGKRFEKAILGQALGLPSSGVETALHSLDAAQFVRPERLQGAAEYEFKHPLTQEVAYASLLSERREELHAAVARALEEAPHLGTRADHIAHHWQAANRPHDAALWRRRAAFRVTNLVPRRSWRERQDGG